MKRWTRSSKTVQGEKTEYPTLWDGLMAQVSAEQLLIR